MAQNGSTTNAIKSGAHDSISQFYTYRGLSVGHNGADYDTRGATGVGGSHTYCGVKGDGFNHNTGWVAADDGMLSINLNCEGKISNEKERSFALWAAIVANDGMFRKIAE